MDYFLVFTMGGLFGIMLGAHFGRLAALPKRDARGRFVKD